MIVAVLKCHCLQNGLSWFIYVYMLCSMHVCLHQNIVFFCALWSTFHWSSHNHSIVWQNTELVKLIKK